MYVIKNALVTMTFNASMSLIGKSLADKLACSNNRVIICQGGTNQFILKYLDCEESNNIKGYIDKAGFKSNRNNSGSYVFKNGKLVFMENSSFLSLELNKNDIVIKGANSLYYDNGHYTASVLSASPDLGTYSKLYLRAVGKSARVIIPISLDKLVCEKVPFTHADVDYFMGDFSSILLPMFYGEVYTEINAFKELYSLSASMVSKGGIGSCDFSKVFFVRGCEDDLKKAIQFLELNN